MNFVDALKAGMEIAERERRWVEIRRAAAVFHSEATLIFPSNYRREHEIAGITIGSGWQQQTQSYDDFVTDDWEVAPPHWEQQ